MRRAKTIVLWTLGALLLPPLAAVIFLATANDNFYRWAMGQVIEGTLDREIRVDGSFSFDVGLRPALIVTDVSIENAPWATNKKMVRAGRIEVQIALDELFSGTIRIPRLVVEDIDIYLETSAEGESNWEIAGASSPKDNKAAHVEMIYPLVELISLKDITVTHEDRQSGRDTEIVLDFLHSKRLANDAGFEIQGEGSFNRRSFSITGRFGSIEEALSATTPYPLELVLQSSSLVIDLKGTVENLREAKGIDINLVLRTASISEVMKTLNFEVPLTAIGEASARLRGNLDSLAVEDVVIDVIERSGQELHAQGRLADLMRGQGLALRFTGKLGPETFRLFGDLPPGFGNIVDGITWVDFAGRMVGDLATPVAKDLQARLEHGSGASLSLDGQAFLDFSDQGIGLSGFEITTLLSVPDPVLLEGVLGKPVPDLGAIHANLELAFADDWVTLRSAQVKFEGLEGLRLSAKGQIGKLSTRGFSFEPHPSIDLSAVADRSRPLIELLERLIDEAESTAEPSVFLVEKQSTSTGDDLVLQIQRGLKSVGLDSGPLDGVLGAGTRAAIEKYQKQHNLTVDGRATEDLLRQLQGVPNAARRQTSTATDAAPSQFAGITKSLPELGPVSAAMRLSLEDGTYRFDDLKIRLGAKDALWVEVTGTLGAWQPEGDVLLDKIALAVSFAAPSSGIFSQLLPPEAPIFRMVKGRFNVQGTTETLVISDTRMTAEGPDGLAATVAGRSAELSLATDFRVQDLALDLDARWPTTKGFYRLFDLDLPELGPVWARATLRIRGDGFSLTGIDVAAGSPGQPAAHVTGEVSDLLTLEGVELTGEFDVATSAFFDKGAVSNGVELGKVRGRFNLSDTDGSLGLDTLSAEIEDTKLFSLSINGLFDDIERRDDLRMEATLMVPDVSQLGQLFGFQTGPLKSLSFTGWVSGSDESFRAEGMVLSGKTEVTVKLSGTLTSERPALRAKIYSPLFRLADFGLVPQLDEPEPSPDQASKTDAQKPEHRMVFGEAEIPFEALRNIDLDLDILLEDLEGIHLDIDKVEAELDIVDGVLRVDPLSFNFVGGRIDSTLLVDASGKSPELRLTLAADNVDLGKLLSQSGVDVPLDGELYLVVDLKATGQSFRSLASSFEGKFDLAIERGQVRTNLLRLTTSNPLFWMFTESARKGYSDMNCLILRFDVQEGVAQSQSILLDTPSILVLGEGNIDFGKEIIDLEFIPQGKEKRLIAISTPFAIQGPLANPSVEVSIAGASARAAGEVMLSPVNLLGSLLPFVSDRGKDGDNPCLGLQSGSGPS